MSEATTEAMLCLLVMTGVTFSIRALPFVITLPENLRLRLARGQDLLPTLFMSLLVVYCLSSALNFSELGVGVLQKEGALLFSSALVFVVHWFSGRLLLSLGGGLIVHLLIMNA